MRALALAAATKQALEQFVTKMLAAAEQGATWTADQAPLLVQEWLRWQLAQSVLLTVLLLGGAVILGRTTARWFRDDDIWPETPLPLFSSLVTGVLLLFGCAALFDAVKVYLAPRVVVLEKFVDLIN
jgi:heme/copper-type cytochrome/quinol oxidase subunit 1